MAWFILARAVFVAAVGYSAFQAHPFSEGGLVPNVLFGIVLAAFAIAVLGVLVSWLAAALLAFTIFFYVVVYTAWLKRLTPQNIVIGGAAGSLPPVIAWAAATGGISVEPSLLFLIIFFWTPPHFWALALVRADDYALARLPMLPVVGDESAVEHALYCTSLGPSAGRAARAGPTSASSSSVGSDRAIPAMPITSTSSAAVPGLRL